MEIADQAPDLFELPATVFPQSLIEPATTAVVVVDMVNWQVPRVPNQSGLAPQYYVDRLAQTVIPNHVRLLTACRRAGIAVIFLRAGCSRPDYVDAIPPFRALVKEYGAYDGNPPCDVIDELAPLANDISLLKTGSGGFNTSVLDSHLRSMGIKTLLYTGVVTNGCVLVTATGGFDLGYSGYLITDATATHTQELQDQGESVICFAYAVPLSTDEIIGMIELASTASQVSSERGADTLLMS